MKNVKIRRIGCILCLISVVSIVALWLFFHLSLKHGFLDRTFQDSVLNMDKEMRSQVEQGLNHDDLEKKQTGLTIFMNDTLVYWNRNDVNPKLMKQKVVVGHDTICSLLSGN